MKQNRLDELYDAIDIEEYDTARKLVSGGGSTFLLQSKNQLEWPTRPSSPPPSAAH
jgi:hypothetical protein